MDLKITVDGLGVADVVDAMMTTHAHRAHIIELNSPDPRRIALRRIALRRGLRPDQTLMRHVYALESLKVVGPR